jgi:hypothetical protein
LRLVSCYLFLTAYPRTLIGPVGTQFRVKLLYPRPVAGLATLLFQI